MPISSIDEQINTIEGRKIQWEVIEVKYICIGFKDSYDEQTGFIVKLITWKTIVMSIT